MDGTLVTGEGVGAEFVGATAETLAPAAGFRPYPGTVNLEGVDGIDALPLRRLEDDLGDPHCEGVHLRPCSIAGVRSAVIRPLVPDYPEGKLELLAPVHLRGLFGLEEGAQLSLAPPEDRWFPAGLKAGFGELDAFDAVVFDLDNTLVELTVDWPAVHDEIERRYGSHLDKPVTEHGQSELFEVAADRGIRDDLDALLASYEREGAETATPLRGLEDLPDLDCAVGICTANAEAAAELSLDRFGVLEAVDTIVGREATREGKPHPAPLLECLDRLGADAGSSLFVGDRESDAQTAVRAETSFLHVDQLESTD